MKLETRSGELAREIDRLVDAIASGAAPAAAVGKRLAVLEEERRTVDADLASINDQTDIVHPTAFLATSGRLKICLHR